MVGTVVALLRSHVETRLDLRRCIPAVAGLAFLICAATTANAQIIVGNSNFYSFPDRGGATFVTIGGTATTVPAIGYARVQPGGGTTAPASYSVLGFRSNATLVTETALSAVVPTSSGRTFVEVNGPVKTAIALTNSNDTAVTVSIFFTDQNGNNIAPRTFTLDARGQIGRFVDEFPFGMSGSFAGTLTFNSTLPIAATAFRALTNQRGDFTFTTQPIVSISVLPTTPLVIAHFANGAGWSTQVVLVNSTDLLIGGTLQFFSEGSATVAAAPLTLTVNGQTDMNFGYAIPARSFVKFETSGASSVVQVGSVIATPTAGSNAPTGYSLFSLTKDGVTVTQAIVPGGQFLSPNHRMFVESNLVIVAVDGTITTLSTDTAIIISNPSATAATVTFELTDLAGFNTGLAALITVPALGHVDGFLEEFFPTLLLPFRGVLRVTAASSQILVSGLRTRFNERGEFLIATIPASNEFLPSPTGELIFPYTVDGGGYTTQFVLFSGTLYQSGLGSVRFFNQLGQTLNLSFLNLIFP